jgi:hypothetical protein
MQVIKKSGVNIQLYFILLTEHVGFIPNNIIDRSLLVSVKRPSPASLVGIRDLPEHRGAISVLRENSYVNLKNIYYIKDNNTDTDTDTDAGILTKARSAPRSLTEIVCDNIIKEIVEYKFTGGFRDALYDILTYDLDVIECFWIVFTHMIKINMVGDAMKTEYIMNSLYTYLKYHNSNYREIFHIERLFFLFII